MKKSLIFIVSLLLFVATLFYIFSIDKSPEQVGRTDKMLLETNKVRFLFKVEVLLQKGFLSYLFALQKNDETMLYDALDYLEAARGFLSTEYMNYDRLSRTIDPMIVEMVDTIETRGLAIGQEELLELFHVLNRIIKQCSIAEKNVWIEFQQDLVAFQATQARISNIYKLFAFVFAVLLVAALWLYLRQKNLTNLLHAKEKDLEKIAFFDTLTQIPNRTYIEKLLQRAIQIARREKGSFYIAIIDLDDFKKINDTYGHNTGDRVLVESIRRIESVLRPDDTIGRLGGDEFLIIFNGTLEPYDLKSILDRIEKVFEKPIHIDDIEYYSTVSIGISNFPHDAEDFSTLIKYADIAMYQAKSNGKNQYHLFDAELSAWLEEEYRLETEIRTAIANGEFRLFYQPKIDTESGKIIGCEALVRWMHPKKGLLSPADFIHVIEQGFMVREFGEWVISEAARQHALWRAIDPDLSMAVNLSVRHIVSHTFYDDMRQLVERLDIDLKHFIFEITEYELMSYKNRTIDTLRRLADEGWKFHLDDFGTGYSSITYLENLPIQAVKIDKSFVDKIMPENREKLLVDAIVDLSHALDITTIAEGVENEYQFRYLEKLGCKAIQGYYFSRPLEPEAFEKLIEESQPLHPITSMP